MQATTEPLRFLPLRSDLRAPRWWAVNVLIVLAVVAFSRLGAVFTVADGDVSPVWPVAGVATALLVLFGLRRSLVVMTGFALASVMITARAGDATSAPLTVALVAVATGIGTGGATALAAGYLVRGGFRADLGRIVDVWRLLVAALIVAVASAVVGIPTLAASGALVDDGVVRSAWFWTVGDFTGVLLAAPAVFTLAVRPAPGAPDGVRTAAWTLVGAVVLVVTVSLAYFGDLAWAQIAAFAVAVALAVRGGPRGAALAIVAQFSVVFPASTCCASPFGGDTAFEVIVIGQAVIVVLGVGLLLLAAASCGASAFHGLPEGGRTAAIVALVGAAMAGGVHIVSHEALEHRTVDVDDLIFVAGLFAVLLLLPLVRSHWRILRDVTGDDHPLTLRTAGVLLLGGLAFGGAEMSILQAAEEIGTGPALAIGHITPVLLIVAGAVATRRMPKGTPAVAAAAATIGILFASGVIPWGGEALGPVLLGLLGAVCTAVFLACLAWGRRTVGPVLSLYGAFLGALGIAAVVALPAGGISPEIWKPGVIGGVLFFSVGSLVIPNIMYSWSIRQIGPARVSTFQTLTPFAGLVAAWLVFDESVEWTALIGFVLVVGSVVLLEREHVAHEDVPGMVEEMSLELLEPAVATARPDASARVSPP